ncbi:MAG: tetratricopeptide repeat protein [Pseudomonadota bacterium]
MQKDITTMAHNYISEGNFQKAINICEDGIKDLPKDETLFFTLAKVYFELEKYKQVKTNCKHVLDLMPDNYSAMKLLCQAHIRLREIEEAEKIIQTLKTLNPIDPEIAQIEKKSDIVKENFYTETYADLLLKQGNYEKSFKIYKNALKRKNGEKVLSKMDKLRKILFLKDFSEMFYKG